MIKSPVHSRLFVGDDMEIYLDGTKKLTQSQCGKDWYMFVRFNEGGKRLYFRVHRIIASVHCDGYAKGLQVNHKNGIKYDNRPANLEWVTPSDNIKHAHDMGLSKSGERSHMAKISAASAAEIKSLLVSGFSRAYLADMYGISYSAVGDIANGRSWSRVGV